MVATMAEKEDAAAAVLGEGSFVGVSAHGLGGKTQKIHGKTLVTSFCMKITECFCSY